MSSRLPGYLDLLERSKGIGVLLITHLIGFARRAADSILFLEDGAVVASGPVDILRKPEHERLRRFIELIEAAS